VSSIHYTLSEISGIVQGKLHGTHPENPVRQLLIDSRKLAGAESSLFFAIKGERHDAHRFIPDLYAHGLRNFVVTSLPQSLYELPEANFILGYRHAKCFAKIVCTHHRKQFSIPVIGITGSNGKTIVKEWLYQLMREEKNIVRSPKSFNSQVGVPLSVWQMNSEHEMALFEAGISRTGEMEKLERIIKPTTGIFTNIGQAHSENFSSLA
jgi:UDP-N-acetylmuramyl pentapeptide synthase